MTVPAVRTVADEVWAALSAITGVNHYDGDVDSEPPKDPDGAVHAYLVFYPGAGRSYSDRVSGRGSRFAWTFQVTCVGGDRTRCLWCVDKVRAALAGQRISIGRITELGGNESRMPTVDYDTTPRRRYVPLDFGVRAAG